MGQRSISEIMREGQEKTLEQVALLEKQMNGTITEDEKLRLGMLNGNLLALMKEAQAQGVGVGVGTGYGEVNTDEDENPFTDEEEADWCTECWDEEAVVDGLCQWCKDEQDAENEVNSEDENGDSPSSFRFY